MTRSAASYPGGLANLTTIHLQASILPGTQATWGPSMGLTLSLTSGSLHFLSCQQGSLPIFSEVHTQMYNPTVPSETLLLKVAPSPACFLLNLFHFPS